MNALHINIFGQVQTVGFRTWMKEKATRMEVSGWVRNASNGSVEAFMQGAEDAVNELLSLSWEGPSLAEVEDILTQDSKEDPSITSFEIH